MRDGKDCRRERLLDRKQELRRVLNRVPAHYRIRYVDHVDGGGISLFEQVCRWDLEGIVAKQKHAPYVTDREQSTWFKILNRQYSQMAGREELFERDRQKEPVPGWHSCALACVELEKAS
jgi:ATP-dependent DNA ligase